MPNKPQLTDAERDSHKATMTLHLETAARLVTNSDWRGAKLSLEMAVPHANAIGAKEYKSKVFGLLNTVRARARKASAEQASA